MNNIDFCNKLTALLNKPTHYAKGCFLQKATPSFIKQKAKQYPSWYTKDKQDELLALPDDCMLADCVGMIKGIIWTNKDGICIYTSNGLPDIDETTMFEKCTKKSSDFKNIIPGELVWTNGHVGVYVGHDTVIECTNAWEKKVIESSFIRGKAKYFREWKKHGRLPWIDYKEESFQVLVEHDFLECFKTYEPVKIIKDRPFLDIIETKDNFGKTSEGFWVDLTKCRRITNYGR